MSDRPTLILMPGLDGTGRLFEPLTGCFPDDLRYRIAAYPPNRERSLEQMARGVVDGLPPGPIILLAESFSGLVALTLLRQRTTAIRSVIFCAAFAGSPHPLLLGVARRLPAAGKAVQALPPAVLRPFVFGRHGDRDLAMQLKRALGQVSPGVLTHRLRLMAEAKAMGRPPHAIPCHYLQATRDRMVPARAAQWFARHFAPFHLWRVDGPHMLLQTRPRECARLIASICQA